MHPGVWHSRQQAGLLLLQEILYLLETLEMDISMYDEAGLVGRTENRRKFNYDPGTLENGIIRVYY
jgi:hypothetical protein